MAPKKSRQLELPAPKTWGGRRAGAGRKPGKRRKQPHRKRKGFESGPVHVTMRVRDDAPYLRKLVLYALIRRCMVRSGHRPHFRICHYSIQSNHLHLICEADSQLALSRGIQGFASAMARRINKATGRRGTFFLCRYHARALTTPAEVRNAIRYVLNNWRKHDADRGKPWPYDPFSSGALFWEPASRPEWLHDGEPVPTATPKHWLLRVGWQRAGATISSREVPTSRSR